MRNRASLVSVQCVWCNTARYVSYISALLLSNAKARSTMCHSGTTTERLRQTAFVRGVRIGDRIQNLSQARAQEMPSTRNGTRPEKKNKKLYCRRHPRAGQTRRDGTAYASELS